MDQVSLARPKLSQSLARNHVFGVDMRAEIQDLYVVELVQAVIVVVLPGAGSWYTVP